MHNDHKFKIKLESNLCLVAQAYVTFSVSITALLLSVQCVCSPLQESDGTAHIIMLPSEVSLLVCHMIYAMNYNILPYVKVPLSYRNFMVYLQKTRTLKVFLLIP